MTDPLRIQLRNLDDTRRLAESLAKLISAPSTLALSGTLGAGKTQFVRFFAAQLGVAAGDVSSPTYVLLQRYACDPPIYHFDFYRLETEAQVWDLGIDELYEQNALVLIEWADKFPNCLPERRMELTFSVEGDVSRSVCVQTTDTGLLQLLRTEQINHNAP